MIIKNSVNITLQTLQTKDQQKFNTFISRINSFSNFQDLFSDKNIKKLDIPNVNFYIYRLTQQLRILIKIEGNEIIIQDIFNHDRFSKIYKKHLEGVRK